MARVTITDVFLRDGLQDENVFVPTWEKVRVSKQLVSAGVTRIEATSFVRASRVPQMADAAALVAALPQSDSVRYSVLALNGRGVERAVAAGATTIHLAASASQTHSLENAGRGTEAVLEGLAQKVSEYAAIDFSAAVSTAFTCPYEGDISPTRLVDVVGLFLAMGITKIGLADTLGTTPTDQLLESLRAVQHAHPRAKLGLHLHNAVGQAVETALESVALGVTEFDGALAGFGGCPFAPGAAGNIATEELVTALHGAGHTTGIDEPKLGEAADYARHVVAHGTPIDTSHNDN